MHSFIAALTIVGVVVFGAIQSGAAPERGDAAPDLATLAGRNLDVRLATHADCNIVLDGKVVALSGNGRTGILPMGPNRSARNCLK